MPTRQQKRAKARAPLKRKRRGQAAFIAVLTAIMVGGSVLVLAFRANPPPITRGAIQGEHWHVDYRIEICGRVRPPFPTNESNHDIHTHGDGRIHIHPQTQAGANENANLGNFLSGLEAQIGLVEGKRFVQFPDGKKFTDGEACPGSSAKHKLEVELNGKGVKGDPSLLIPHDKDKIAIRFGPEVKGEPKASPAVKPTAKPAGTAKPTVRPSGRR